jgi:hypothetical protein
MVSFKQRAQRASKGAAITLILVGLASLAAPMLVHGQIQQAGQTVPGFFNCLVRGISQANITGDGGALSCLVNNRGDLLVAQSLPERAEIVRLGSTFSVLDGTGVVDLTGVPTTLASLSFWNGEPDGGRSYIVDRVFANVSTSAGAASAHTLFCMLNKNPVAAPSGVSETYSTHNGRPYPGAIVIARGATVTNDGWFPCPNMSAVAGAAAATTTIGLTVDAQLNGAIIIPPRYQFNLAMQGVNATEAAKFGMTWEEVQLTTGR